MELFHRTSREEADRILSGGKWRSLESPARIYFSTVVTGQNAGYGEAVLWVTVPDSLCELDDEFPDGEQHYAVPVTALNAAGLEVSEVHNRIPDDWPGR